MASAIPRTNSVHSISHTNENHKEPHIVTQLFKAVWLISVGLLFVYLLDYMWRGSSSTTESTLPAKNISHNNTNSTQQASFRMQRDLQQGTVPGTVTVFPAQKVFPNPLGPSDEMDVCLHNGQGKISCGYIASIIYDYPREQFFSLNGSNVFFYTNASSAISTQLYNYLNAANLIISTTGYYPAFFYRSSCSEGNFQTLYFNFYRPDLSIPPYLTHFVCQNQNITIFQSAYQLSSFVTYTTPRNYFTYNIPVPVSLLGNQSAYGGYNSTGSYRFPTDSVTNYFPLYSPPGSQLSPNADYLASMSYDDGSVDFFTQLSTSPRVVSYNSNGTLVFNQSLYNQSIPGGFSTYNTPLPVNTSYATFISSGINRTNPTVYIYDVSNKRITASKLLAVENYTISNPTIAHCGPQNPDMAFYATESLKGIRFDFLNTSTADSLAQGPQYYNVSSNSTSTPPPRPKVGCTNWTAFLGFIDGNQDAAFLTSTLQPNSPAPAQAPTSTPTPVTGPLTITVSIPSTLNKTTFIPLNTVLNVSASTNLVQIVNNSGFDIVFTANNTAVPTGVYFNTQLVLSQMSIALGNGTLDTPPVFEGCNNITKQCSLSIPAADRLTAAFNGMPFALKLSLAIGIPAAAVVTALLIYRYCKEKVFPYRDRAKADWVVEDQQTTKTTKSTESKEEDNHYCNMGS